MDEKSRNFKICMSRNILYYIVVFNTITLVLWMLDFYLYRGVSTLVAKRQTHSRRASTTDWGRKQSPRRVERWMLNMSRETAGSIVRLQIDSAIFHRILPCSDESSTINCKQMNFSSKNISVVPRSIDGQVAFPYFKTILSTSSIKGMEVDDRNKWKE